MGANGHSLWTCSFVSQLGSHMVLRAFSKVSCLGLHTNFKVAIELRLCLIFVVE